MKQETFSKIALEAGIYDTEVVAKVYHGLLRHIRRELGNGNEVFLDELGTFSPRVHKGHRIGNVNSREEGVAATIVRVKFTPCINLKKYVRVKNADRIDLLTLKQTRGKI